MGTIGVYGFGRIGRTLTRIALDRGLFQPAAVADIKDPAALSALFAVDSNYGRWPERVDFAESRFQIGTKQVRFVDSSAEIPDWRTLGVDVVVDCSARATKRAIAQQHVDRGAKKVLVSGPSKTLTDCDAVLLPGINLAAYDPARHHIVSLASCTTNALAPLVKVLTESVGIESGFFSAVHAYTNSQSLTDQPMSSRRDSWAAAENIIPSTSGAARALLFIWPELPVTGKAYRVPVRTGSIVELIVTTSREIDTEAVRDLFRQAAASKPLAGVMDVLEEEFASSRIVADSHSSIVDLPLVQVVKKRTVSVAAWYDNEFGFSNRLAEAAVALAESV